MFEKTKNRACNTGWSSLCISGGQAGVLLATERSCLYLRAACRGGNLAAWRLIVSFGNPDATSLGEQNEGIFVGDKLVDFEVTRRHSAGGVSGCCRCAIFGAVFPLVRMLFFLA